MGKNINKLIRGNVLEVLKEVEPGSVDIVLIDPPYSSGGLYAGDRKISTRAKYTDDNYNGAARFQNFSGDNMDQRSFTRFMADVSAMTREKTKPGGVFASFIDWRNLPALTDAIQIGGWIWRGIVVWNKGISRNQPGRFRNDCEYVVWGTNGPKKIDFVDAKGKPSMPGCYNIPIVSRNKLHHQTEKPVELLKGLLRICPEGGTVLDCFMGSGSTGVACVETGRNFIGIELDPGYYETACARIQEAQARNI